MLYILSNQKKKYSFIFLLFSFSNLFAQFTTNGTATNIGGECYRLTSNATSQLGSVFNTTPVDLSQPFSISGTMNFGTNNGGADGISFLFATSTTALGTGGGGMGYEGITPSVIIEFDTWQNPERGDPAADHCGINTLGVTNHNSPLALTPPLQLPNLENGQDHCFIISWDPASLVISASLDGTVISYNGNVGGVDISSLFSLAPNTYFGFVASTGGAANQQVVCFEEVQITPMQDQQICEGESVQLQADPSGISYSWAPNPTLSNPNISNPIATPTTTTTYSVTVGLVCSSPAVDDVTVVVLPSPNVVASNTGPYCVGETIQLSATGVGTYSWTGPSFSSSQQNPTISNAQLTNGGLYTVQVTGANGCITTATTNVLIFSPQTFIIPPNPICLDANPIQLLAVPPGGTWGGVADVNGVVDPSTLAGVGTYNVTYSTIESTGCMGFSEETIDILTPTPINIISAGPYCLTGGIQTLIASPLGGVWSGAASSSGQINPTSLGVGMHSVTYTFSNGVDCDAETTFQVEIFEPTTVTITPAGPFCQSDGIQTMEASIPGGLWGGLANSSGQINTGAFGAGTYEVTYSVNLNGCVSSASTFVTISQPPTVNLINGGIICEGVNASFPLQIAVTGEAPIELVYAINNIPQTPIDLDFGVNTIDVTEAGTYSIVSVTDATNCTVTSNESVEVEIVDYPIVASFETVCNPAQTQYQVIFEIAEGDPNTYDITSDISGTLSNSPPYIFTSDFINSGDNYSFIISDNNLCDITNLSGSFSCMCVTDAGTLDINPISACVGESITAIHNGDEMLDQIDDDFIFILHDGSTISIGNILATSTNPSFELIPPMTTGTSYFITAIAGNSDGNGGIDFADACLSVSLSVPVLWQNLPTGALIDNSSICLGQSTTLFFSLTGNAPFSISYTDGSDIFDLSNISDGFSIDVSPTVNTTYELISISDNSNPSCSQNISSSVEVLINESIIMNVQTSICDGQEIILEGEMQTSSGIFMDTLSTSNGCDSIIITDLTVNMLDTTLLEGTSCNPNEVGEFTTIESNQFGCDSTIILTVIFSDVETNNISSTTCDSDMAGVFTNTFMTDAGCDSIVIETVTLLQSDTTLLEGTSCNPNEVGEFTTIESNQFGCDSTIILTVIFSDVETNNISSTTCDSDMAGVFTNTFMTDAGCDSIVIETVTLLQSDTTLLEGTSCNPNEVGEFTTIESNQFGCDSTIILTVIFSDVETNNISSTTCDSDMAGVFTNTFMTDAGCDSIVIETITLLQSDTTLLEGTSCNPNEVGEFTTIESNQFGCDSTIILTVIFLDVETNNISSTTCDSDMAGVFTNTFMTDAGCDSIVIETITLLQSDTTLLEGTSCNPNEVGEFTTIESNQFGCDSTIILTVIFSDVETNNISSTTCDSDMAGVFTNTFMTDAGCDSIVIETVTLLQNDTTLLEGTSCNPNEVGEFTTIESNQFGCDSTIILTVIFSDVETNNISSTTCDSDMAGVFTNTFMTDAGCDSIVIETVTLLQSDTIEIESTTCNPNEVGVFTSLEVNQFGCDSLIIEMINLLPSDNTVIDLTTCDENEVGEVIEIVENQFGCDSIITTITTLLSENECGVEAITQGSTIACDEQFGTISITITQGTSPFQVSWTGNQNGNTIIEDLNEITLLTDIPSGDYSIEIQDSNAFLTEIEVEIEENFPPDLVIEITSEFGGYDIACWGAMNGSATAIGIGGQAPYQYFWSNGEENADVNGLGAGIYTVTIIDALECENEEEITLTEPELLELTFEVSDLDCFSETNGVIIALANGGEAPYLYALNGGVEQEENIFLGLTAGTYEVSVEDANNCKTSEIIWINAPLPVDIELGENLNISLGDDALLSALVNIPLSALDTVIWSAIDSTECPSCLDQIIAPLITTTYSVTVQAENGCSDTDELTIFVDKDRKIFVPNAFSPNGNGDNDVFMIFAAENTVLKINSFQVVDRWGELMFQYFNFQPNDPVFGWNGYHNGQPMNSRVYVWYAEVEFIDGSVEIFEGDVLLAR